MKIGSDEHKQRFCREFIASHCRFDPETLAWPDLDAAALERLRGIPFWQEVLYTERRAGAIVAAYAATITDPLVREAVTLQGFEEARHAELLRLMIQRYSVAAEERLPDPPTGNLLHAFADFGYGECLDAFLGFGVFKIARRAGFLPEAMFEIFETLIHAGSARARCIVAARRNGGALLCQGDRSVAPNRLARARGERRQGFLGDPGERVSRRLHVPRLCRGMPCRACPAHGGLRS